MPSTIGKCKLFRIKHTNLLEGETFLRNKHHIAFFEVKCIFFGRKENIINVTDYTTSEPSCLRCFPLLEHQAAERTVL